MSDKEHTLLCVIGRTASGKDSLVSKLCENTGLIQLISYTTRERRINEPDTHIFVTKDDYISMMNNHQVAVDTQINGKYYWSSIDQLYKTDIYIVDYIGFKKLQRLNLPDLKLVSVLINVPENIREERAVNQRKDNKIDFKTRNFYERSQFDEMAIKLDFDYAISNIDFAKSYSVLHWISDVEGILENHLEEK